MNSPCGGWSRSARRARCATARAETASAAAAMRPAGRLRNTRFAVRPVNLIGLAVGSARAGHHRVEPLVVGRVHADLVRIDPAVELGDCCVAWRWQTELAAFAGDEPA